MTYDVAIIGAGIVGASLARLLSSFELKTVLLEKAVDVGFGVSKANSGIVHAGFHHSPDTLKARLEIKGNQMYDKLHDELAFPFKRNGIIVAAFSSDEMKTVRNLFEQGVANGVPGLEICGAERLFALEPKLNPDVAGGLYAPRGGVVEPYRYVFSLVESAVKNGVELFTQFEVVNASFSDASYKITSSSGQSVTARYVVNAAGLYADKVSEIFNAEKFKIHGRKGEEFLLDRNTPACPSHVIFPVPAKESKGMLVIPTVEGTVMIGPTADMTEDKEDLATTAQNLEKVFLQASRIVMGISRRDIITSFAGIRPAMDGNDFYIDKSKIAPNFFQAAGIQSPGLTAAPAIAEYIKELMEKDGLKFIPRNDFDPFLPKHLRVSELAPEEIDALSQKDKTFSNIICRCEHVSEAEIIEAIRKGHTTIDGIKFYTRAGMGRCQGGFCSFKILKIISRETGMSIEDITKRGGKSYIVSGRLSADIVKEN